MKKLLISLTALSIIAGVPALSVASPEGDKKAFQGFYMKRFPGTPFEDFANGVYSIDPVSREQWEAIEEFPPYEIPVDEGKTLFETPFKNGKTYASCFPNDGIGIRNQYPYFDTERGKVITIPLAVNECRIKNGEKPLKYKKGKMAAISSYMAYTTRGKKITTKVSGKAATEAYEDGKQFYYARRGQLNMSCAHCHVDNSGNRIRADILSPALGHLSHFPVYRSKWGELGTVHRRFGGCNKQVRAKPFKAQSKEYRNLEYFLTYMGNGLTWNGPGARK